MNEVPSVVVACPNRPPQADVFALATIAINSVARNRAGQGDAFSIVRPGKWTALHRLLGTSTQNIGTASRAVIIRGSLRVERIKPDYGRSSVTDINPTTTSLARQRTASERSS